jgi:thiopeptide-type bacteriocin biosynthesis protein
MTGAASHTAELAPDARGRVLVAGSERTQEIVELLLESFRNDDLCALCRGHGIEPDALASLRASFISAGTAYVHEALHPRAWLQVNLILEPLELRWLQMMRGDFPNSVRLWIETGRVDQFFFLHKPPGMRLRFLAPQSQFIAELYEQLDRMVQEQIVQAWSRGVYDPEVYQFGGQVGLDLAHEFFTAESLAVLAYHHLRLQSPVVLAPAEFSLVLLDPFLRQVTEDEWELWDLWCKLELTGRLPGPPGTGSESDNVAAGAVRKVFLPMLRDYESTLSRVSDAERKILLQYRQQLPRLVQRTRQAVESGVLLWGIREIIPFWIIFHWNRMGFDFHRQSRLAFLMSRILNPRC